MEKKPIIKLRAYRGREINYDANGKIKNENNLVSLEHNTKQWVLFMKNLPLNGYCKVEVEKAFKQLEKGYEPIDDLKPFEKEVQEAFNPKKDKELTPEQKQIAELTAKLESFMNNGKSVKQNDSKLEDKKEVKEQKGEPINEMDELRDEYERVVGKKPHHMAKADKLQEGIDKAKK